MKKLSVLLTKQTQARLVARAAEQKTTPEALATTLIEAATAPAKTAPLQERSEADKAASLKKHPCRHYNPEIQAFSGSQGTCQHPTDNGRPCFWAANLAYSCQLFHKRLVNQNGKSH